MFRIVLCALLMIAGAQTNLYSQSVLKNVQQKLNGAQGFETSFEESIGGKSFMSGRFYFRKENKVRVETKNLIMVSDGKTTWNYNKPSKKIIISEYNAKDVSLLNFGKLLTEYPEKCNVTEEKENGTQLLLFEARDKSLPFKKVKCTIGSDNTLRSAEIAAGSQKITISFSAWKFSAPADKLFGMEEVKGAQVIDLR